MKSLAMFAMLLVVTTCVVILAVQGTSALHAEASLAHRGETHRRTAGRAVFFPILPCAGLASASPPIFLSAIAAGTTGCIFWNAVRSMLPLITAMGSSISQSARQGHKRVIRQTLLFLAGGIGFWFIIAYLAAPDWWKHRERHEHPALFGAPRVTSTPAGIPGDPLNLFIVGSEEQLVSALLTSGWHPADPVTLKTSLRIAEDSVLRRSYEDAPVSALMLFGRKQDMAFEKPAGVDPRKRHHVRFWKAPATGAQAREAWWGAVTFDRSEGLSHTTGEVTHHIAPDIDQERDLILEDLRRGGSAATSYKEGFQNLAGKNGGGDPWQSDGRLGMAVLPREAK